MLVKSDIGEVDIPANVLNVLMADDDEEDFYIFSVALDEMAMPVILSRVIDGDALMTTLEHEIPDILFLDLAMPCKDGNECLKEIRSHSRFKDLPILICTSFTNSSSIDSCFKEGANYYLIKPNSIMELANLLKKLFTDGSKLLVHPTRSEFVLNEHLV